MGKAETATANKTFLALRIAVRSWRISSGFFALLAIIAFGLGQCGQMRPVFAQSCGEERWPVKTLADQQGMEVSQYAPQDSTINKLTMIQQPDRKTLTRAESTRFPAELKTYQVDALVLGFKQEGDSDFHIVLADPNSPSVTMIAEIPSGTCAKGQLGAIFDALQRRFADEFGKPTAKYKKLKTPKLIRARGVGFFDFLHGQTGVARNGFELHPLLGWDDR